MKRTKRAPTSGHAPRPAGPNPRSLALLLIAVAAMAVYATSLQGPFVFDDRGTIVDNRTIEDLGSLDVLSAPHETPTAGRPAVNVSFALNYAIGGRQVVGYHVGNIALHLLCGLALFGIVRRTQPSEHAALAVALIWIVHPLNSEVVNYITQRTESMMALCYLLTLYCAIRADGPAPSRRRWAVAAVAACLVGMASKESMVTAPLAVVFYDRLVRFDSLRAAFRARGPLYLGMAATWLLLAALVAGAPRSLSAGFSAHDANAWTYLLNQAVMITRYLRLAFWPTDLVLYYGWPLPFTLDVVWPRALVVVVLLGLTVAAVKRYPRPAFLGLWFFLTLAPTSSILPIATEVGAERRMYLPLIAVVTMAVFAFRRWVPDPRLRLASLAAVTLLLGAGTVMRTNEYRSSLTLAVTTVERWPTPGAHSMLGTELAAAGRLQEAERHLREAAPVHPPARYYLGTVLAALGTRSEAIDQLRGFIGSQPPELDHVHLARAVLADTLTKDGRLDEAAAEYRSMLARGEDPQAMVQLAQIYMRQQRFSEAIPLFEQALSVDPSDARTFGSLGVALGSTGRLDEAIAAFERAVELDPNNASARANLARALSLRR